MAGKNLRTIIFAVRFLNAKLKMVYTKEDSVV